MTALEKALERLEKVATNFFASLYDFEKEESDFVIYNGIRAVEGKHGELLCPCGRVYKSIKNWQKHVISMHRGSI